MRIEEVVWKRLVEKFAHCDHTADGRELVVSLGDEDQVLTRKEAVQLRDQLTEALSAEREFLRTACTHREDGGYVVERRHAESAGHRKVFDSFDELTRLFGRLPDEFTAEEVGRSGLTGARRHLLVRHFNEHPAFECELVERQPLTVRKASGEAGDEAADCPPETGSNYGPDEELSRAD
jgi:hypothetical protein